MDLVLGNEFDMRQVGKMMQTTRRATIVVLPTTTRSVRVRELGQDDILVVTHSSSNSRSSDYLLTNLTVQICLLNAVRDVGIARPDHNTDHPII